MPVTYIESIFDNKKYCKTNGQFTRHLREFNITYQQYYEQYITKISPKCGYCNESLAFYQNTETYANSCGKPGCRGKSISFARQHSSKEVKELQSKNYRNAQLSKSFEQKQIEYNKKKQTYFDHYGTSLSNSSIQKNKSRKSKIERHGDEKYNNSGMISITNKNKSLEEKEQINEKRRKTCLDRYGVESTFLLQGVKEKSAKSNASGKEYILPSGKIISVRGNEDIALTSLLESYNENDLIIHNSYEKYELPIFSYVNVNQHSALYYPDIYIPNENKVIEVKSRWWWDGDGKEKYKSRLENNLRKTQAVLDKGYLYDVWLFTNKKSYEILSWK
jgi:hypothetical protein